MITAIKKRLRQEFCLLDDKKKLFRLLWYEVILLKILEISSKVAGVIESISTLSELHTFNNNWIKIACL